MLCGSLRKCNSGSPVPWLVWIRILPIVASLQTEEKAGSNTSPALKMATPHTCGPQDGGGGDEGGMESEREKGGGESKVERGKGSRGGGWKRKGRRGGNRKEGNKGRRRGRGGKGMGGKDGGGKRGRGKKGRRGV